MSTQVEQSLHCVGDEETPLTARHRDQQAMASGRNSLTTFAKATNASAATVGNHLTAHSTTPSTSPATLSPSSNVSPAAIQRDSGAPSAKLSTVRLIDYPSSEEEVKIQKSQVVIGIRVKPLDKQGAKRAHSAEFVNGESGGSDADTSDHLQHTRKAFPRQPKRSVPARFTMTSMKAGKMKTNDFSWGASSSSKKRPLPPAPHPPSTKRPKQGPFTESDSEDVSGSDDDDYDAYNFDGHVAAPSERPSSTGMAQDRFRYDPFLHKSPTTSLQRQGSDRVSEIKPSASKILASQSGKDLNKDRLKAIMAQKQGGLGPNSTTRPPTPTNNVATALKNRPQNATKVSPVKADVPKALSSGTIPAASQAGRPGHSIQGNAASSSTERSQEYRRLTKEPGSSQGDSRQVCVQQVRASASDSARSREASAPQLHKVANISSTRNLLNTERPAHREATQEPERIGNDRRRAQAGQATSFQPAKDRNRPEVGARYGHTLVARRGKTPGTGSPSPKGAPAAVGNHTAQKSFSASHASLSAAAQALVKRQTQASAPKAPLTSNTTSSAKQASTVARQLECDTRQAERTVLQSSPLLGSKKRMKLTEGASAQHEMKSVRNGGAVETGMRPSKSSSLQSSTVAQQAAVSNIERSVPDQGRNSMGSTRQTTIDERIPKADHGHDATDDATRTSSSRGLPVQPAVINEIDSISVHPDSTGGSRVSAGLDLQTPSVTPPPASSLHFEETTVENVDEEAPGPAEKMHVSFDEHVACASKLYTSSVTSVEPSRMPVAIMVRPGTSSEQGQAIQSVGDELLPASPVVSSHTLRKANVSRISKCQRPSPGKQAANADKEPASSSPLVLSRAETPPKPEASESIDVSPINPDTLMLDQDAPGQVAGETFFEHASVEGSNIAELASAKSVNNPLKTPASSFSSMPGTLQPASTAASESRRPLLGAHADRISAEPPTTTFPPSTSSNLLSQSSATHVESNDAREISAEHTVSPTTVESSTSIAEITLTPPTLSPTAESYFEYTICQTITSSSSNTLTTELSTQPFTTLDSANAHTEKLFRSAKQQYELLGMQCSRSTASQIPDTNLSAYEAEFTSIENPSQILTLSLRVQRAEVSVYADHTPSPAFAPPLICKTLFALRLWRLTEQPGDSDSGSDSEAEDNETEPKEKKEKQHTRLYHPFPQICTELHTSLDSANRAAKRVQIALSHEKEPARTLQAQWQVENLRDLNGKLEDLCREVEEEGEEIGGPSPFEYEEGRRRGCWRSMFRGVGPSGFDFELLVTTVGVSGPRNI